MATIYEKDKKTRVTVRLSPEQFDCIKRKCDVLGISPSDFIRMLINSLLYSEQNGITGEELAMAITGGLSRENDKADSDN